MTSETASDYIDQLIARLDDWRGGTLAGVRRAILAADAGIVEEWKYMGSPVWSRDGTIAVGNAHKDKVKLTFSRGASLTDPQRLFNNGLGGKVWRAIDLHEGETIEVGALTALVREAIEHNQAKAKKPRKPGSRP